MVSATRKAARAAAQKKYRASEKGKLFLRRPETILALRLAQKKYRLSEKGALVISRRAATPARKAANLAAQKKYLLSEKGKLFLQRPENILARKIAAHKRYQRRMKLKQKKSMVVLIPYAGAEGSSSRYKSDG